MSPPNRTRAGAKSKRESQTVSEASQNGRRKYDVSGVPSAREPATWPIFRKEVSRARDPDRTYPMYIADELGQFPPVEWLIPGWLAANELTVLYGPGDTYKSFIALTWACQLAAEGEVVFYIAAEGVSGLHARVAAWQVHNRVPLLPRLVTMGLNVNLHEQGMRDHWAAELEAELLERDLGHPALVVVDTLARNFVGGDESSPRDMGEFVEGCEAIRRRFDASVVPVHHTMKGDKVVERGTESLRNASFAMLNTDRRKLPARQVKLSCDRMKDAEPPKPLLIEFEWKPMTWLGNSPDGEPASSLAMKEPFPPTEEPPRETPAAKTAKRGGKRGGPDRTDRAAIRAAVERGENGLKTKDAARKMKLDRSNVQRRLKSLVESGYLECRGMGRATHYVATERGVQAVEKP